VGGLLENIVDNNYRADREAYMEEGGKRVHGLRVSDDFDRNHSDQNRGANIGGRLYLTENGEWIEINRVGRWSDWQGEAYYWYTSQESAEAIELEAGDLAGSIRPMTDEEVADEYDIGNLLDELGKSLAELCKKLPARYNRLKANTELAQRTIEALK
jgi:hypothetical protein